VNIRNRIAEVNPEALFIDEEFADAAIIGVSERCGQPSLVIYDYDKLVNAFYEHYVAQSPEDARDTLWLDAVEWVDVNIVGAWHGPNTPIVMQGVPE